jgi:hypothetical protein
MRNLAMPSSPATPTSRSSTTPTAGPAGRRRKLDGAQKHDAAFTGDDLIDFLINHDLFSLSLLIRLEISK